MNVLASAGMADHVKSYIHCISKKDIQPSASIIWCY